MKKVLLYCLVLVFFIESLFADSRFFTSPFVFGDNISGKIENRESLSPDEIIEAAMIFSGEAVSGEIMTGVLGKFGDLKETLSSKKYKKNDEAEKAERILLLMYDTLLKTYQEDKTTIGILFEKGEYNCVSSAVLFLALGKSQGLDVRGQKTTEHAFCKLYKNDDGKVDSYIVETTNPYGFNPGTQKKVEETGNYLKYIYVPKINYSGQREVNDLYLCSLIASNLCSLAMKRDDYERAIPLAYGLMLLRDYFEEEDIKEVESLFSGVCNNYIFYLQSRNRYEESLEFINELNLRNEIPELDMLKKSLENALENYFYEKIRGKDFDGAGILLKIKNRFISDTLINRMEKEWWIYKIQEDMKPVTENNCPADTLEERLSYLSELQDRLAAELPAKEINMKITEWKKYIWQKKIINSARNKDFSSALNMIEVACKDVGESSGLVELRGQILRNYEAEVHNKFAVFFNSKNYEDAEKAIQDGLLLYPESKILKKDLELIEKTTKK